MTLVPDSLCQLFLNWIESPWPGSVFFEGRCDTVALRPRIFGLKVSNGEFDPGSGRTLAARLTHASRGRTTFGWGDRRTGE